MTFLVPAEVETERLLMRQWRASDLDGYAAAYADETHAKFIGGPCSRHMAWRRMATVIGHWHLRGYGFWAVEEKASGRFVGSIGLWYPEEWPELEVGYWLAPDMVGRGYATEAARKSRDLAYEHLGINTLISCIDHDNHASRAVVARLGAVYERDHELLHFGKVQIYRHPSPEALKKNTSA
ncbi:GNAT family N-acetyltransferase [Acanthopleuribacter pedis]|uniref:GNAT family N-acetyltransferase n=1 Tax=Acanthopleuribacter pedis TaxID=442870 RepID=A0A8J7Q418_9BACT|nr:GNAT family N-acetyltransferase [Acanthopleuribacter pedis]MBO1320182.1 GNAT family N-acetyltransferase [Acanthopleuribacter pedis]